MATSGIPQAVLSAYQSDSASSPLGFLSQIAGNTGLTNVNGKMLQNNPMAEGVIGANQGGTVANNANYVDWLGNADITGSMNGAMQTFDPSSAGAQAQLAAVKQYDPNATWTSTQRQDPNDPGNTQTVYGLSYDPSKLPQETSPNGYAYTNTSNLKNAQQIEGSGGNANLQSVIDPSQVSGSPYGNLTPNNNISSQYLPETPSLLSTIGPTIPLLLAGVGAAGGLSGLLGGAGAPAATLSSVVQGLGTGNFNPLSLAGVPLGLTGMDPTTLRLLMLAASTAQNKGNVNPVAAGTTAAATLGNLGGG